MKKNVGSNDLMQLFQKYWTATLLMLLGCFLYTDLMAQNLSVSGTVRFSTGEAVPGANVSVKGSANGTMTNADGTYNLTNVPANSVLQFSFIGMETQEVNLNGRKQIDVVLKESAIVLDEVVAIGYGTAKKKDLTGSVSAVGSEKLMSRQNNQVITALQGAMAGVTITRSSSAPGVGGTIRVRGITSIQESDPLIIIDGVPASSINDVNPADVENITVLKDAASASIYGARAAAGVVLITTKRGSRDGMNVDYNYSLSLDVPTKMPEYANAVTYMKVLNERNWNDNNAGGEYSVYEKDLIDNYWSLNKQNSDLYPNTDWVNLCMEDYGVKHSHQLGISSGNEKSRTKVSFGYDNVDGLYVANNSWKRITARVNNDIKLKKWLSTSIDLGLKHSETIEPAFSPSLRMRYAAPVYPAIFSDGRLAGGKDGENPYGKLVYGGNENSKGYQVSGKVSVDIKPIEDLTITGVFAPIYNFSKVKRFNKQVEYYTSWDDMVSTDFMDDTNTTDLRETRSDSYSITSQIYANYNKTINKHNISATLGYETFHYFYENLWASRGEYDIPYYPYLAAGPSTLMDNNGDAYENAYNSYIGRVMYNWGYKYYVQANFRYDGSSRFHKDHRWAFFPSASLGWVISKENFMQDIDWLSFAKLRLSYGQLGNERIGNYPYQSSIEFNTGTLYQGSTIIPVQGASAYQYAIQDISWETTETIDLGLDLSFFRERLKFTGDYYQKKTMDMLLQLQIPNYMGYTDPDQNAGTMSTKGWEIDLGWSDKIGDFSYGINFNLYDSKTVMGELKDTQVLSNGLIIREGSEYNEWYGYKSDGIFQTAEEIASSPVTSGAVMVGDIKYKDISGPEGTPDGKIDAVYDRVLLGGSLPRFNYGGNINLGYKGFDFLVAFQGIGKRNSMITEDMVQPIRGDWYNVPQIIVGKYWSNYNSEAQNANAKYPRVSRTGNTNNYAISDFWMIDGSYFRIKNITLGYTIPSQLLRKISLQNVRFYASLQDIFTISNYPLGWDPEVSSTGYPITKSVIFGVSVKF
ncbi:MAG: TonB-dependent receptor [Bacteroidales bacterium]|nr:TonB-dependent receptor [Bacteroidales bacterium]MDD4067780.1 TonB-dependent receptor [Bacteroidales bacterium]